MNNNIFSLYDFISFDLFDTLIYRKGIFLPNDLNFLLYKNTKEIHNYLSISQFYKTRILAEKICRLNLTHEDINIKNIYDIFNTILNNQGILSLPKKFLDILIQKEEELNLYLSEPNINILQLYNILIKNHKNIIITSDFFIGKNLIEKILAKCQYTNYTKIYISTDLNESKYFGSLYQYILSDLHINNKAIIHVGDNIYADGVQALKNGINYYYISNPYKKLLKRYDGIQNQCYNCADSSFLFEQAQKMFVKNDYENMNIYQAIACECLFPLLMGFIAWLYAECLEKKFTRLFFCSRDGYIMKQVFDLYQKQYSEIIPTFYIQVSRQVLYKASLRKSNIDNEKFFSQNYYNLTPKQALSRFGMNYHEYLHIIKQAGFENENEIIHSNYDKKLQIFYNLIKKDLYKSNKKHFQFFLEYLQQINFFTEAKPCLIDIGWHGTFQKAILHIVKQNNLAGRYLGMFLQKDDCTKINAQGFLCTIENDDLVKNIRISPSLIELLHGAPHGSVTGYFKKDTTIHPKYENKPTELKQYEDVIVKIQQYALEFIEAFINENKIEKTRLSPYCAFQGMQRLLKHPSQRELNLLGHLKFATNYGEDADTISLIDFSKKNSQFWNFQSIEYKY